MIRRPRSFARLLPAALIVLLLSFPSPVLACACGCGVFEVQTGAMLPNKPGGIAFLEYDFMNQNKNWAGWRRASDDANADKRIRTSFVTAGVQYMLNRRWGYAIEVPYWSRRFVTRDPNDGTLGTFDHGAVGDVRVRGVYSGFSEDMSSGVTFGLKLPTGDFENPNFDRDTEIGTGSTDLLLGAYRMGFLGADWGWFGNAQYDQPMLTAAGYRPGSEAGAAAGIYYDGFRPGGVLVAPLAQAIASNRWSDSGTAANSEASGYRRLVLAPGFEASWGRWRLDASVGFPVYQYTTGDQVVASEFYRAAVSWAF